MKNRSIMFSSFGRGMSLSLLLCISAVTVFAQDTNSQLFSVYSDNSMPAQSAACYGDYLIQVKTYVSKMSLYNLRSKNMLYVRELSPLKERRGTADIFHANNCSFGVHKFKDSDVFPLLYVSHRENNDNRGVLQVYRILPEKSQSDKNDFDNFSVILVQTIYYPPMTDENALGSPWTAIDQENNCMYVYSRNNRKESVNKGKCRISQFRIPPFGQSREVYLSDADILDSYEVDFNAALSQGACVYGGMMYIGQGKPSSKSLNIRVVDLKQKKLIKTINLKKAGFTSEPEGCFIYNNNLMISTAGKRIFKINIPLYK